MGRILLAVLLALGTGACRRPKVPKVEEGKTLAQALAVSTPTPAALAISAQPEPLPAWTERPPRLLEAGGRRVAVAVGRARTGDLALSRIAAQDLARAEIVKLLEGKTGAGRVQASLRGGQITQTYTAADGSVYVEVTAPVPASR